MDITFNIIVAINDWNVCRQCIQASSYYLEQAQLFHFFENNRSASITYNRGIREAEAEYLVFAHQDIYFPAGWFSSVADTICELNKEDPNWAVLGIIGIDEHGFVCGRTWSTGLKREVGNFLPSPMRVQSIDELIIIVNRRSNIFFDEQLPGFHLYGTDIIQIALSKGLRSYVIDAPVIHNSLPSIKLDESFVQAYRYMQKKWKAVLPIKTLITPITLFGLPLKKKLLKRFFKKNNRSSYRRLDNPAVKAKELGYEQQDN